MNKKKLKAVKRKPRPELMETINDLVRYAKTGEIHSVAIAVSTYSGEQTISHSLRPGYKTDCISMIGNLERIKSRMLQIIEYEGE